MARDQEEEGSVYDFLYIDSRRIALFLSQLDSDGNLKALTRSASQNAKSAGGVDLRLAKMGYDEGSETSIKKEYDTQWVAPLLFLDEADKRGLIERDLNKARIGRLVLLSGRLSVFDLATLKGAWEMPVIKNLVQQGAAAGTNLPANRQQRRQGAVQSQTPPHIQMMFGFLALWPHVTQVTITGNNATAWGTISDDSLITSASDLALKHGVAIAGTWSMVGILDALPDTTSPADPEQVVQQALAAPGGNSLVGTLVEAVTPLTKQFLGRPSGAHGITPLLIFRDVSAKAAD